MVDPTPSDLVSLPLLLRWTKTGAVECAVCGASFEHTDLGRRQWAEHAATEHLAELWPWIAKWALAQLTQMGGGTRPHV